MSSEPVLNSIEGSDGVRQVFGLANPYDVFCLYGEAIDEELFTSKWNKHDPDFQAFLSEDFELAQNIFEEVVQNMKEEYSELKTKTSVFRGEEYFDVVNCASGVAIWQVSGNMGLILSSDFNPSVYAPLATIENIRDYGVYGIADHCKYERLPEEIKDVLKGMNFDFS